MQQSNQTLHSHSENSALISLIMIDQQTGGTYASNPAITVNPHCLHLFEQYTSDLSTAIISVCGEYRTGKSFLLNKITEECGFEVGCTTNACTKGITMLSKPLLVSRKTKQLISKDSDTDRSDVIAIWILDSEGLGSLQKDSKYDSAIFLISLVLSNIFLYNTVGAIDRNAIQRMALMCKQASFMSIETKQKQSCLFWVLRDFALSLMNSSEELMIGDSYLSDSFQKANTNVSSEHQLKELQLKMRTIYKLFPERHCFPLIRPCISEQSLNSLDSAESQTNIRQQFTEQIDELRQKLFTHIIDNADKSMNLGALIELLEKCLQKVNELHLQGTQVCWQQIRQKDMEEKMDAVDEQCQAALQAIYCRRNTSLLQLTDIVSAQQLEEMDEKSDKIVTAFVEEIHQIFEYQQMSQSLECLRSVFAEKMAENKIKIRGKFIKCVEQSLKSIFCTTLTQQTDKLLFSIKNMDNATSLPENISGQLIQIYYHYINTFKSHKSLCNQQYFTTYISKLHQQMQSILTCISNRNQLQHTQQMQQLISCHEIKREELTAQKAKLEQYYESVINRMEKINDILRSQLEHKSQTEQSLLANFSTEMDVYKDRVSSLESETEDLKILNQQLSVTAFRQQNQQLQQINAITDIAQKLEQSLAVERSLNQQLLQQRLRHDSSSSQSCLQIVKLTQLNNNLQQSINTAQTHNIYLTNQLQKTKQQLARKQNELKQMADIVNKKENDIQKLNQQLRGILTKFQNKQQMLTNKQSAIVELNEQVAVLSLNIKQLTDQQQKLQSQYLICKQEHQKAVNQLQSRNEQQESVYRCMLKSKQQKYLYEIQQLNQSVESNRISVEMSVANKYSVQVKELEVELSANKNICAQLNRQITLKSSENQQNAQQLRQLNETCEGLKENHQSFRRQNEKLQITAETQKAQILKLSVQNQQLSHNVQKLQNALKEYQCRIVELQSAYCRDQKNDLQLSVNISQNEQSSTIPAMIKRIQLLEYQLASKTSEINSLQKQSRNLHCIMKKARTESQKALQKENSVLQRRVVQLEATMKDKVGFQNTKDSIRQLNYIKQLQQKQLQVEIYQERLLKLTATHKQQLQQFSNQFTQQLQQHINKHKTEAQQYRKQVADMRQMYEQKVGSLQNDREMMMRQFIQKEDIIRTMEREIKKQRSTKINAELQKECVQKINSLFVC